MDQGTDQFNPPKTIMIILTIFSLLVSLAILLIYCATKEEKHKN
jgi:hypothetical protein